MSKFAECYDILIVGINLKKSLCRFAIVKLNKASKHQSLFLEAPLMGPVIAREALR